MNIIDTITLPIAADVARAAERLEGVAVRTPLMNAPVLDEHLKSARLPQSRNPAAHRLVQVPRRL